MHKGLCEIKRERSIRKINKAILAGAKTGVEISNKTGLSKNQIYQYSHWGYIKLPNKKGLKLYIRGKIIKNKDLVDRLLFEKGETLENVGKKVELSRERIRQYLVDTHQYEKWEKAKREKEREKEEISLIKKNLVNMLVNYTIKKGYEERVGEAIKHHFSKRTRCRIPLENIIELVKVYKKAKSEERKLNYKELAKLSGIKYAAQVGRLLKAMNLRSFYLNYKYTERIEKINEAIGVGAGTVKEISKYTGIPRSMIEYYYKKNYIDLTGIYGKHTKTEENLRKINKAIGAGAKTGVEISKCSGVSLRTVYKYSRKGYIDFVDLKRR